MLVACGAGSTPAGVSIAAAESKRLRDALSRVGVMGSEVPKASFATKHLEQDLGRLLQVRFKENNMVRQTVVPLRWTVGFQIQPDIVFLHV